MRSKQQLLDYRTEGFFSYRFHATIYSLIRTTSPCNDVTNNKTMHAMNENFLKRHQHFLSKPIKYKNGSILKYILLRIKYRAHTHLESI